MGAGLNLVLLVEGAETEPRVYQSWLSHRLPQHRRVPSVADLTTSGYVLVSGKGYPSCYRRIGALLQDIQEHPGSVGEFWICIDSDEDPYEARYAEADRVVQEEAGRIGLFRTSPALRIRLIIQR